MRQAYLEWATKQEQRIDFFGRFDNPTVPRRKVKDIVAGIDPEDKRVVDFEFIQLAGAFRDLLRNFGDERAREKVRRSFIQVKDRVGLEDAQEIAAEAMDSARANLPSSPAEPSTLFGKLAAARR